MFHSPVVAPAERADLKHLGGADPLSLKAFRSTIYLSGASRVFQAAHLQQLPLVLHNVGVHNIDCAMRFNTFLLVDEALRHDLAPEHALENITVQRAFTPYQILDALHHIRRLHSQNTYTYDRARPARVTVYFLLAPCKQFFDGDVADDEGVFLLNKMVAVIAELQRLCVPLLIAEQEGYRHAAFLPVHRKLQVLAGRVYHLLSQSEQREKEPSLDSARAATEISATQTATEIATEIDSGSKPPAGQRSFHHGPNATSLLYADRHGPGALQRISQRTA